MKLMPSKINETTVFELWLQRILVLTSLKIWAQTIGKNTDRIFSKRSLNCYNTMHISQLLQYHAQYLEKATL